MNEVQIQDRPRSSLRKFNYSGERRSRCPFCPWQRRAAARPRNRFVARTLNNAGLATLLFDLLTPAHRRHTGLAHFLEKRGIKDIYLIGLALDYCVKYSTLDASDLGLNAHVIVDGCRGIELEPDDVDRALDEMKRAGAVLLKSTEL